jgi:methionyl-tRNA formyltransferase
VLDLPSIACINIHSSLLPRWRGAAPIHHAVLAGDPVTGVTTMKMVKELDAGDIYEQAETPIAPDEFVSTLHDRLAEIGGKLILSTIDGLAAKTLVGKPQDPALVTYAHKLTKEMEVLDPNLGSDELARRVRALNPWPGTSVYLELGADNIERLKVRAAKAHSFGNSIPRGVLTEKAGMLLLGTAEGTLELLRVQPEGKKEMEASSFLNGLRGRGIALPLRVRST